MNQLSVASCRLEHDGPCKRGQGRVIAGMHAVKVLLGLPGRALRSGRDVDVGQDRHAGAQAGRSLVEVRLVGVVEVNTHRNALHDFHVVAGGVLRRKQAVLGAGGGADAGNVTVPFAAAVGVNLDLVRAGRVASWPAEFP